MDWSKPVYFGKYEVRRYKKINWLKIFYQNITDLVGFADKNEALQCNLDTRYSILGEIDETYRLSNGKYELIIETPENGKFNRWRQKNFPTKETEENGKTTVEDYTPIHIGMAMGWGGLSLSAGGAEEYTLLNGTPGVIGKGSWYYAIGQYTGAFWYITKTDVSYKIPVGGFEACFIYLWLRIPNKFQVTCWSPNQSSRCLNLLKLVSLILCY